jgi:hypothetical protein
VKQANDIVQPGYVVLKATVGLVDTWLSGLAASATTHGPPLARTETLVELMVNVQPVTSAPEDIRISYAQAMLKLARVLSKEGDREATAVQELGKQLEASLSSEPSQSVRRSLIEAQEALAALRSRS